MSRLSTTFATLRHYDWPLVIVASILMTIGFAAIYSVDLSRGGSPVYFPTQLIAFMIGAVGLFFVSRSHMSLYQAAAPASYAAALLLLLGVLIFGETIRGTTGWFRVGSWSFQPAEFAKVALVLLSGFLIHRQGRRFDRPQFVVLSGLVTGALALLILLQPDVGSAAIIVSLWFGLLLLTGAKKRHLVGLLGIGAAAFFLAWFFLFHDYQKDRLITFFRRDTELLGAGYNVNQSIIAVGAGSWLGRGLGFGSQSQLHFLPEAQSDFIFAVIAEELGFVGAATVLALYGLLIWRLIRIAGSCRSDFGAYTVLGIVLVIFIQVLMNIGAATGLLPVTGLPLPFLSYGGSALIMNLILIGVAESIARGTTEARETAVIYG